VDLVFTDPPYNVPISGHASGLGRTQPDDFVMASGEMTSGEFMQFLVTVCTNLTKYSRGGSNHYILMDYRHIEKFSAAGAQNPGGAVMGAAGLNDAREILGDR